MARHTGKKIRFLTLTTSEIQYEKEDYLPIHLNDHFRRFKQIIRRTTIQDLIKNGYLKPNKIHKYYPNKKLGSKLQFDYFKITTNEGNGVIHLVYKGNYIPYNYIVDIWNDIHLSWDIHIKLIKHNLQDIYRSSLYVVGQYISNQSSSYQRSSQSWLWTIRGYRKKFNEFIYQAKNKFFYNPIQQKFYYKRQEIRVFDLWLDTLLGRVKRYKYYMGKPPPAAQTTLF
jgi:hypothetical protein